MSDTARINETAPVRWEEGTFPAGDGTTLFRRSASPTGRAAIAKVGLLTGYGDHGGRYTHFMGWMAARGISVHALDFRGQGRAAGKRGYVARWSEYLDDLAAFLALPEWQADRAPDFLLGQSHGSLVMIHHLLRGGATHGAVFIAPYLRNRVPATPGKLLLAQFADRILPYLEVSTDVPPDWMSHDPEMLAEDAADPLALHIATPRWFVSVQEAQTEARRRAGEFTIPFLMVTGDEDQVADTGAAAEFFAAAVSEDKTHLPASACRHEPLRELDREVYFCRIHDWIVTRAALPPPPNRPSEKRQAERE